MLNTLLLPYALPRDARPGRICGIRPIQPGETCRIADLEGPGCIRHLYMTMPPRNLRDLVFRCWWDDEPHPSIECPVNDFFGIGHDLPSADLRSPLFYVAPKYGYNCYIPMPYARRARLEVTNESGQVMPALYLMLSFERYARMPKMPWRFHTAWRRVMPGLRRGAGFSLLEAKGEGRLLGVIYHICKRDSDDRWSHGGGDQLFIDGDTPEPSYVAGVGGEDFAHHAWGLAPAQGPYSGAHEVHPVPGVKRGEGPQAFEPHGWEQHDGGRYSMYRYFIPDPVRFRRSLRLTFGACANELSATTYWYQNDPHAVFQSLPPREKRGYSVRLAEEEYTKPLAFDGDLPVAVLGPMMRQGERPWSPERAVDLAATYETDVRQPYGDVVRPPYEIRWRRSPVRGGFIDLAAIHRPKRLLRIRGLWNKRHLPLDVISHVLLRVRTAKARRLTLRVGYEDRAEVWVNGRRAAALHRPEPLAWTTADAKIALKAGVNDVVIECSQERMVRWSAWGLFVKFLDARGAPAKGLAFEPFAQLDPTPERYVEPWPPEEPVPCEDYRDPLYLV